MTTQVRKYSVMESSKPVQMTPLRGEREWTSGMLGPGVRYRIIANVNLGTKHIEAMIQMLQLTKEILEAEESCAAELEAGTTGEGSAT